MPHLNLQIKFSIKIVILTRESNARPPNRIDHGNWLTQITRLSAALRLLSMHLLNSLL